MITFIRLFKSPSLTWGNMSKIVSKMTILWKILKISEMIQDDLRWVQGGSGSLPDHQSLTKKVTIWRRDDVQKTPSRSHMNPQNHSKIHKSLVLAHNIHKDRPLGVAKCFSHDIWCEALSFIICSEGPEGENQGFNAKVFQINFKCFVLAIYGSSDQTGECVWPKYIKVS